MHQVEIELNVPVEMRDGTVLRADVYRPAGEGRWPVLLQRTPYGKSGVGNGLILDMLAAVERGYVVIHQDTRGRFASDGEWLPWHHERQDGYDTVVWAAKLPYCDGKVGMIGGSYTGQTQWTAAIAQPPGLHAIAPMITWSDPANGLMFRGGAIELGLNAAWCLMQSLGQLPKTESSPEALMAKLGTTLRDFDGLATGAYAELPAADLPAVVRTGLPDIGVRRALADPATMGEARVEGHHGRVTVPSLNVAGWYDIFQQGTLDNYVAMRANGVASRLVVGPWHHYSFSGMSGGQTGEVNFGVSSCAPPGTASVTDLQLSWFDRWLKDAPASAPDSAESESGVQIFVMGINEWRNEETWPPARAVDTPLYLGQGASLTTSPPAEASAPTPYRYDPADPTPTCGGAHLTTSEFPSGPADQARIEQRPDVLVFTGEPLTEDLEVTGRIRARLFAATDGPSTDWVVRLCDVDGAGVSRNVVDGIVRVQSEPGQVSEHEIDLWSTSIVFKAGHRLRVQVTSSNFPRWDRNLNTGEPALEASRIRVAQQQVFHDAGRPSCLVLPVIPR